MNENIGLRKICALLLVLLLAAPGVDARTKHGDRLIKKGQEAEARQQLDEALDFYEQALATDPSDAGYMLSIKRARFQSSQKHVNGGQQLRTAGQLEDAIVEFQKAIAADPSSAIALQEWRRTTEMLEKEKTRGKGPVGERGLTPSEKARREADQRAALLMEPAELKPIINIIPSLKMNNQPPKVLYETVAKLAGINVIFDQQMAPSSRNLNVEFSNSSIEQALDYLGVLTKTFWKAISPNTIFVTEDNVTKHRDYDDHVVKIFFIQNATSVQEFQEFATAVRSLTDIRRVYTYNAQKALLMRGTADQIALADKLIHDLDKPKAEVVIDVLVMEANTSKTRDIAMAIVSAGKNGLNLPINFTPNGSGSSDNGNGNGTTDQSIRLGRIGNLAINNFSTTVPSLLLNLVMSDRQTRVLQSPQVRASDGQKVTLRIGDKIPYATGSFQPGVGSVGVSPLVSTQFNFAEVGVNVDITPQVHGSDEVTLKVAVEVSNVRDRVSIGGVDQPIIGQRKNETEIRLKEGEVNILGGLSQTQDSKSLSGIPGLVNLPILGRLLGSESITKDRGQLLIALVPHIVRTPNYSEADLKAVASGTEQAFKMSYAPRPAAPGTPAAGQPGAPPPAAEVKPPAPAQVPGLPDPAAAAGGPKLVFMPPAATAALSGAVSVTLQVENVQDLFSATPLRIKFDPKQLRLSDVTTGEFLAREGQSVNIAKDIRNDAGEASIMLTRVVGTSGVSGSGTLATFTFFAIGKGTSAITVTDFGLKNSQQQPVVVTPPELRVTVQ